MRLFIKSEPQNIKYRMSKGGIVSLSRFFKNIDRIHSFEIRHSLFDIHFFKSFYFD